MSNNIRPANRFTGLKLRYWGEVFKMMDVNKPVDMAIGMPDYKAQPQFILDALSDIALHGDNSLHQYTLGTGHPRLVNVLAKLYGRVINKTIDPMKHILTTVGAYEALFCSVFGLVSPGEEVIIIEPHYDAYLAIARAAGAVPVFVGLNIVGNEWKLDFDELESKMNEKTRLIIVTTPHNPLGKVFTRTELEKIAELCVQYNVIPVMDEVYEWITYEDNKHFKLASIDGMFERSISIGSVGKAFSVTGWKCGWAITGDPNISNALFLAHSICCYACPTVTQEAAARAFEIELDKLVNNKIEDLYWTQLKAQLLKKRNYMTDAFNSVGLRVLAPEGSYFMVTDCRDMIKRLDLSDYKDERGDSFAFVKWLSEQGLQGLPLSVMYAEEYRHLGDGLVRFCYFKSDQSLAKAALVLREIRDKLDENNNKIITK